jgi:hypothetical protein
MVLRNVEAPGSVRAKYGMTPEQFEKYVQEHGSKPPMIQNWRDGGTRADLKGGGSLRNVSITSTGHDSGADDQNPRITTDGGKDMGIYTPPSDKTMEAMKEGIGTRAAVADGGGTGRAERQARAERRSGMVPQSRMGKAFVAVAALAAAGTFVYLGSQA